MKKPGEKFKAVRDHFMITLAHFGAAVMLDPALSQADQLAYLEFCAAVSSMLGAADTRVYGSRDGCQPDSKAGRMSCPVLEHEREGAVQRGQVS